jgi:hypothetical protein
MTLLKNIPSLDFMQQFLSQLTAYPDLNQFMEQINPLLDSIRTQIMNCFNQNAAIDPNHQNILIQFKTNFTNLFELINLHAETESNQLNDNQIILIQIDNTNAKESSLLKSQENIITTITSSSKDILNTITKNFAESDIKIIKFIKTISKNFTALSINDSRWNNLSLS